MLDRVELGELLERRPGGHHAVPPEFDRQTIAKLRSRFREEASHLLLEEQVGGRRLLACHAIHPAWQAPLGYGPSRRRGRLLHGRRHGDRRGGRLPDRFGAVASFHGDGLATDAPTSPHRCAPQLKANVYIAAAADDRSYPPEMASRLEAALTDAGVRFRSETYPAHGWMMPDFPVYDRDAAERGWSELNRVFKRTVA